jgi:predicted RNA binding protein YcfA (HicA-like mRNA interferase family)
VAQRGRNSLVGIRQQEALNAFVRLGGTERRGKGSHCVVNLNGMNLSIPHGQLKEGLLRHLIKISGFTVQDFLDSL